MNKKAFLHSQKHVFWQAFFLAGIIFGIGILLGFTLESWRINRIENFYIHSETQLLDVKIQQEMFSAKKIDCKSAISQNIKFADDIFNEAKILERYEKASRLSDRIIFQHKKYDLLRTLLWINSMKIKDECNASYHNILYFYQYNDASIDKKAKQRVFSKILGELKEKRGSEVLLIPIAADNNLNSINLLLETYGIDELPLILIDEKIKITELKTVEEIDELIE
jgi:hypothetical protein